MLILENIINTENSVSGIPSKDELLKRLNFALKSAGMGAFDCDLSLGTMSWDLRMHELFGVEPESFSGNYDDFVALLHSEDRPKLTREKVTIALGQSHEFEVEFRINRPGESAAHFLEMSFKAHTDEQDRPQSVIGVCRDITEQRSTEAALVRERYFLSTMMDNFP